MLKRVVSFVLSIAMMVSVVPVQTFAAEVAEEAVVAEETTIAETTAPAVTEETESNTSAPTETAEETEGTVAPTETEAQVQEPTEAAPTEPTVEETIPELAQEAADAYSGICGDDLTWTLSNEGVLTISGTGDMYDYSYYDAPWYDYERPITALSLDVRLTSIGDCAFVSCTELTSVTIPDSVTSIGDSVFEGCTGLTSVAIGNGVTSIGSSAFYNCTGLTSVTIPDSVTSIESDAFSFCNALRAVYIPSSVTTISAYEDSPFRGCSSSLVLYCGAESKPSGWDSKWNNYSNYYDDCYLQVYWNCTREVYDFWTGSTMSGASVTIPGYVNLIPDYAFADRTDLTSVTIPASVTYVGTNAFSGCSESLSIRYGGTKAQWLQVCCSDLKATCSDGTSDSVIAYGDCGTNAVRWVLTNKNILYICGIGDMSLGYDAVPWSDYKDYIGKVIIGEGVTNVGGYAFYECPNITEITIPSTVKKVGVHAFLGLSSIKKVHISDLAVWCTVDYVDEWNSGPMEGGGDLYLNGSKVTSLVVPEGVTYITRGFSGCDSITGVVIPEGVTTIGSYAFNSCDNLVSATLPSTLTEIGDYAFSYCDLSSVTLPEGLVTIGERAFESNYDLTQITFPRSVEVISAYAFYGCSNIKTITFRQGENDILLIGGNAFYTWNKTATAVKVPNKAEIHDNISGYDWSGDNRTVTYTSHNCSGEHYPAYENAVSPTCTQAGSTGRIYCEACGATISEASVIPALGHIRVVDEGYAATCTDVGLSDGSHCERCNATLTVQQTIPALGHGAVTVPGVPATCTSGGLTEGSKCSRCGVILTEQETIAPLGHALVRVPAVEATCTSTGLTEGEKCSRCGYVSVAQQTVAKLPHTSVYKEAVAPTCTETGLTEGYVCSVCGGTISGRTFVAALGHTEVPIGQRLEPTCSTTGLTEGKKCSVCGVVLEEQTEIATLPHDFDEYDICVVCGAMDAVASGSCGDAVSWRLKKEGTLILSGTGEMQNYGSMDNRAPWSGFSNQIRHVVIEPGITSIGNYAFYYFQSVQDVTLPESLVSIGSYAFYACPVADVTIPAGVTEIGEKAFVRGPRQGIWVEEANPAYSSDADGILYDKSMTTLLQAPVGLAGSYTVADSVTGIGDYAFYSCPKLVDVVIPDGVAEIGKEAFRECKALVSVTIGNGVASMGKYVFAHCTGLTTITLPDSLTSLGELAFYECSALTYVKLSNSITRIEQFTFSGCTNLSDVVIPEGVTRIGWYSFSNCMGLTEIVIPRSVTEIDDWAFNHCENLGKVIFLGTRPEFGGNHVFNCSYPSITYPVGAGWGYTPYFHGVTWIPVWGSSVRILNAEGENVSGTTARVCLNLDARSLCFRTEAQPLGAYGECTWEWSKDLASVTENADGSITVTPTGKPGTMTLKAISKANSKLTASMTIHFLNAEIQKEEIPGQDPADMALLSGKSKALTVLNQDTGKPLSAKEITWTMDEGYAPYAKIDAKGKITAQKVVEKVRVEAIGTIIGSEGTTVTVTVDIFPAVSTVELLNGEETVNNKTVNVGSREEPLVLTANIHPLDAMEGVDWVISDKKEAFAAYEIVGNVLTVTPKADAKAGAVTIKATSTDGSKKTATVKLQFGTYAKSLTIDKSVTTLTAGDKAIQLSATMEPAVVTKSGIVWSLKNADDKNYVNLSSSGKITPKNVLAPVDVTIVATSKDGMAKDEHTIRIMPKSQAQLVIMSGDTYVTKTTQILDVNTQESITLAAYTYGEEEMTAVDWAPLSNKAANITLNADGTLTIQMIAAGSINVTAKAEDGRKATVTVKGVKLAQGIEISQKKTGITEGLEVASGKSLDLQATLTDAASKKVTWSIAKGDTYATISNSGKFAAAKDLTSSHKVVVKAVAADGSNAEDTMEITVRPIAQGVQVYSEAGGRMLFSFRTQNWWVRSNTTLNWDLSTQADTIAMDARVYPYYGDNDARNAMQSVTWKSSAPKIAEFVEDEEGNVSLKLHKTGSVTITATAADGSGQKVTFKLNIVKTVTELKIDNQTVVSGKSLNLAKLVTINPTDATNKKLTWKITRVSAYATISSSGSFKAKKVTVEKTVEVTVSSQDGGASKTFYVTITP